MGGIRAYHEFIGDNPNHLVASVVETIPCGRVAALDLGAGNLRDSRYLKRSGFERVVAVDRSEDSIPYAAEGIELTIKPIEKYRPAKGVFDLIVSCNTLFFLRNMEVEQLLQTMHKALRPNGIIAFNVLGNDDPWSTDPKKSAFSKAEVLALTQRFKTETFDEVRADRTNAIGGSKFWHHWVLVLRKP